MQRVLDLDLDAFVYGSEDGRTRDDPRLDAEVHPPWDVPKVLSFLQGNCRLSQPLPGFAVEHHGDLFFRWRDAIEEGLLEAGIPRDARRCARNLRRSPSFTPAAADAVYDEIRRRYIDEKALARSG